METQIKTLGSSVASLGVAAIHKNILGCSTASLCVAAILFIAITGAAQTVWDGTADTTWYTDSKNYLTYTITTPQELAGLALLVNGVSGEDGNGTYNMSGQTIKLGNDIMLNDTADWQSWNETEAPTNSWVAIGTDAKPFIGTFDGAGYVISGVYINNTSNYQGLFGYLYEGGIIKNIGVIASYIKGSGYTGSLVGSNNGSIINCYSTSIVKGSAYRVGGLVGSNGGTVSNSYSTGAVICNDDYVGGLVGFNDEAGIINNSYYDLETSEQSDEGKGIGKTTSDMQSKSFTLLLNIEAIILSMNAWVYTEGKYPLLSYQPAIKTIVASYFESGNGTEKNPYIITTKEHLRILSAFVNAGKNFSGEYFKLGNDIELNDTTNWQDWGTTPPASSWVAIGTSSSYPFSGSFDGAGYVISGVYMNNQNNEQGLFGILGYGGTIKNIGLIASYIEGGSWYVGGLVANNYGTVSNSYSASIVKGSSFHVGGLVGRNDNKSIISNCYSTSTINGTSDVGGLVGNNYGTISNSYSTGAVNGSFMIGGLIGNNGGTVNNSYSTGTVSGSSHVGGLVGDNVGTVNNSYSTGAVNGSTRAGGLVGDNGSYSSKVNNSYYDLETSKQSSENIGTGSGKTTADMKKQSTYLGFDFDVIWGIDPSINSGYPYLKELQTPPVVPIMPKIIGGKIQAQTIGNNIVLQNLPTNSKVEVYNLRGGRIYVSNRENPRILRHQAERLNSQRLVIGVPTKGMYIVKATHGSERQVMRVTVK